MEFTWEARKAEANDKKHGVRFPECLVVSKTMFPLRLRMMSPILAKLASCPLGWASKGRVLVVIYAHREAGIRII
jgi:uncharacterized DUF497 family protein